MRIAVIGDGAMGTLFGALLSQYEEVSIISLSQDISAQRTRKGIAVDGKLLHPVFTADPHSVMVPDLLLLFVKSSDTESALENASCLIGEHTLLMTLQNGAGHEAIMRRYAPMERIVIGKTEQNASLVDPFTVHHGNPRGATVLSMNGSDLVPVLGKAGFPASVSDDINRIVWRKLLTNASLSAATGVLDPRSGSSEEANMHPRSWRPSSGRLWTQRQPTATRSISTRFWLPSGSSAARIPDLAHR